MTTVRFSLVDAIKNMTDDPLRWPLWRRLGLFRAGVYKPGGPFRPYAAVVFPPDHVRVKLPLWLAKVPG